MPVKIEPATTRLADLVRSVRDDQLADSTPCPKMTVGQLIDHVSAFAVGFTLAARADPENLPSRPPPPDVAHLGTDWRERIPSELATLAAAWSEASAWEGMTQAGGIDMPSEVAGRVAIDESIVHGWDLAVATGQPYDAEPELVEAARQFVAPVQEAPAPPREGLFGPPVAAPADASPLATLIALTGRDPNWSPS
jgi:uncharacterized protein (TIGR03086 family)